MQATTVITFSVSRLDVTSRMVMLASGVVLNGMTNGNIVTPVVRITQAMVNDDVTNAHAPLSNPESRKVNKGKIRPKAGISHRSG